MERLERRKAEFARQRRNPAMRSLVLILSLLLVLSVSFSLFYSFYSTKKLKQVWLSREAALLGSLAERHPELAEEWFDRLASPDQASPQAAEEGRRLLERYGVGQTIDARWLPALEEHRRRTTWILLLGNSALIAIAAALLYREYARQSRVMRKLAVSMEDAVKRNEPMSYRLYEEGDLGLLASGAQELSQRLKETIEQLNRDKAFLKETVADISHQLKTPLASLMIYTDLLQDGKLDETHTAEFLGRCRRELDRMEWLILTLLKLARLEADALELNSKSSPLAETVKLAVQSVHRLAEDKQVRIVIDDSDASLSLLHDAHWMGEALANLLKNAVEHSPPGGEVAIGWEQTHTFTHLHVKDQGPGIDPRHLPHIFKKFYRTSGDGGGVGLGLPLARSIIEKHGGVLSATANVPQGTAFHVTLPLHPFPSLTAKL